MGRRRKPGAEATLISSLVHRFLDEHAPSVLTGSTHTLKSYRDALSLYLLFLESRGVTCDDLSRDHFGRTWIEGWVAWLRNARGNSNGTCNVRLASLRAFLEYAASRDPGMLHFYHESKLVKRQKPSKAKVEGMSKAAVTALLAAPDTTTAIGRRDAAFLTLMYSSACRLDEVRTIAAGQVHIDGPKPYVTVRGKGGKVRTCYLVPKTARILRAYMREVLGAEPGGNDLLFPSPVTGGPLTERAWDKRIKAYAGKAHEVCPEVPVGAHCHQLRHAKASHWIEDRLNVVEVQHLLGHEQLATTMRYVDVNGPQEVEALATLSVKKDPKVDKKWKRDDGTLRGFCGLG
ncbi:MAG: tyrosine-type recombinase/integrase [Atopobiaceae bacterium]|nr:tyrosine-type recombinase/integrase [Atopobiaceae bacterium]